MTELLRLSTTRYNLEAPTLLNILNSKHIMSLNNTYCPIFCNSWVINPETGLKNFFKLFIACYVFSENEPICFKTPKEAYKYF